MIVTIACAAALAAAGSGPAGAGERVLDGALGALSGGIVFGPVGLVAGGVTGAVAGPGIARGLGLRGHHHRYARR